MLGLGYKSKFCHNNTFVYNYSVIAMGYVDQVFAKHICGQTLKFVTLAIFVIGHCNNTKNCVILTKCVLLSEIHTPTQIFVIITKQFWQCRIIEPHKRGYIRP